MSLLTLSSADCLFLAASCANIRQYNGDGLCFATREKSFAYYRAYKALFPNAVISRTLEIRFDSNHDPYLVYWVCVRLEVH